MKKKLTPVEWSEELIKIILYYLEDDELERINEVFEQAKQMEIEQAVDLLTKYHDNLFYIPLKECEAENIYNYLNTIENDTNLRD